MPGMRPTLQFDAYSLTTLIDAVKEASEILSGGIDSGSPDEQIYHPIWYRGHTNTGRTYKLLPGLYRDNELSHLEARLAEESRIQHYSARAIQSIENRPHTSTDWLELMQHYQVKTRLMDWSENMFIAAMFALEPFISNPKDERFKNSRRLSTPSIWLLNPILLNKKIYGMLHADTDIIDKALMEFSNLPSGLQRKMKEQLKKGEGEYFSVKGNPRSGIVNLSLLLDLRIAASNRLPELLNDNRFNPFYYLLLKLYNDGVMLDVEVPPLAVVSPFHSKRIETQHGVFTVFPFPPGSGAVTAIEENPDCYGVLAEIRLNNPYGIAKDLRTKGFLRTDLYPDLTEYGQSIEWR